MTPYEKMETMTKQRLAEWPNHPVYNHAAYQLSMIEKHLQEDGKLSKADFEKVTIGRMCAYELEPEDEEYCQVVYKFLTAIEPDGYSILDRYL